MMGVVMAQVVTWFQVGTGMNGGMRLSKEACPPDTPIYDKSGLTAKLRLTEKFLMKGRREIQVILGLIPSLMVEEMNSLRE